HHLPCTEQDRAPDRHLSHGTAAPDGHRIGRLDVALGRSLPAGRKYISEEKCLFVAQAVGHLDMRLVRERNPDIFGLPAWIPSGQVCVAEKARRGMAEGFLRHFLVAVASLANGEIAALALVALSTEDREGNHDAIPLLKRAA